MKIGGQPQTLDLTSHLVQGTVSFSPLHMSGWPVSFWGLSSLPLIFPCSTEFTDMGCLIQLYMGSGDPRSGLETSMVSTLPTKPSAHPYSVFSFAVVLRQVLPSSGDLELATQLRLTELDPPAPTSQVLGLWVVCHHTWFTEGFVHSRHSTNYSPGSITEI